MAAGEPSEDRHAHSLSPSSSSSAQSVMGETVPVPFVIPDRNRSEIVNIDSGEGISVKVNVACPPSDKPS